MATRFLSPPPQASHHQTLLPILGFVRVVTTAETKSMFICLHSIGHPSALFAPLRLHHLEPGHTLATATDRPVGLLEPEETRVWHTAFLADIFPLRPVIKASAMSTLPVGTLLDRGIVIVHNNSPFRLPVFPGTDYHNTFIMLACKYQKITKQKGDACEGTSRERKRSKCSMF